MKWPFWKIAGALTIVDVLISLPYLIAIHTHFFGEALTNSIVRFLNPYWVAFHYPTEYLVFAIKGGQVMHDPMPLWLPVVYIGGCFAQTFIAACALVYIVRRLRRR